MEILAAALDDPAVVGDAAAVEADEAAVVALVELEVFVELLQAPATRPAPTKSAANARLLVTSGFSLGYGPRIPGPLDEVCEGLSVFDRLSISGPRIGSPMSTSR